MASSVSFRSAVSKEAAKAARIDSFIESLPDGYNTVITDDGINISKGQRQLITIARALLSDAPMLILDEATSNLDPVMRDDILDLLLDFVQDEENGVLFATHIMSDLAKIADYIVFLHEGKLLFSKTKDDLIYHYGIIHCGEKIFQQIEPGDILAWRKQDYEYQILVADRDATARKYKNCIIDPATLDDIMLLNIRGEKV